MERKGNPLSATLMADLELLRVADVAALLKIARPTLYTWIKAGKLLPPERLNGQPRWRASKLREWLDAQQAGPAA